MIDEPLVDALADGRAVVFVGSGASVPSGLPDWRAFLRRLLDEAMAMDRMVRREEWDRTESLIKESERRRRTSAPLTEYFHSAKRFVSFLNKSLMIRKLGHDFILYEIDYESNRLLAHHAEGHAGFSYGLDERSLAGRVFVERKDLYVKDTQEELAKADTWLNKRGVKEFEIDGPIYACPIRAGGQTEAVLVTWLKGDRTERLDGDLSWDVFTTSCGQALRIANLLANDIYDRERSPGSQGTPAERFLERLDHDLRSIDHNVIWSAKLGDPAFRDKILEALTEAVVEAQCGLARARVWAAFGTGVSPTGFECIDSFTSERATVKGKPRRAAYVACRADADDVYCRYTIARYRQDPFARWQHPAMFGQNDRNAGLLDKDPDGSWIVAPIVRRNELRGFISADNHQPTPNGPKEKLKATPREVAFQCRVLDLVSYLAQFVIRGMSPRGTWADAGGDDLKSGR
jgi:hypothetical protein